MAPPKGKVAGSNPAWDTIQFSAFNDFLYFRTVAMTAG
ncbi:hypothetical protein ALP32_200419 [Pseudomonas avellanae]|uniref:Uncharacterized protein n=1 Tax=Pseudomonas avellanae TaxID=46257 RepID=A0A3M5TCM8_9PSED|nr:hypothetical protein ALP32_200419 [Pseudomonas avellanae]